MSNHLYYNQLDPWEKSVVDITIQNAMDTAKEQNVTLYGDDRSERAAEALAKWIFESRKVTRKEPINV